jgi:linoleoyl-CoA desaturase
LNFQVEHHLFPRICHVHYPDLSRIVERTCRDCGVPFRTHRSFLSGVASHYRWLRRMGQDPALLTTVSVPLLLPVGELTGLRRSTARSTEVVLSRP